MKTTEKTEKTEKTEWIKVPDTRVRHIWKATCACQTGELVAAVSPDSYEESGTPVCPECGDDFTYDGTEVRGVLS